MISLYHLPVHLCAPCTKLNNKKYKRQGVIMFPCKLYFPKTVRHLTENKNMSYCKIQQALLK